MKSSDDIMGNMEIIKQPEILLDFKNAIIDEINQLHKEIQQGFYNALDKGKRIGYLLIQEKLKLKHGNWIPWIGENLDFGLRQVQKYIFVYENHKLLNANLSSHLALSSINIITSEIRNIKKGQKKKKIEAEKKLKEKEFNDIPLPETVKIWKGKFKNQSKKIPSDSIDAIITDPPYSREYLEDWKDLSLIAKRILRPSGFLITYSGILNLNEVLKIFDKHLIYYWQFILLHTGVKQLINPRNIFCGYKPILVYQKEPFKRINNQIEDVIKGTGREKDGHPWQQAEDEIRVFIENFTRPNDLILDAFAGSGTIPVVCYKLKRRILAIEKEKENILKIKKRIKDVSITII